MCLSKRLLETAEAAIHRYFIEHVGYVKSFAQCIEWKLRWSSILSKPAHLRLTAF